MEKLARREVSLLSIRRKGMKSTLDAYVETGGDLVLEGYDIGSEVEAAWGDSDYEYWLRFAAAEKPALAAALLKHLFPEDATRERWIRARRLSPEEDPDGLLLAMLKYAFQQEIFPHDAGFREWSDSVGVPSSFSSWT